ncbi:hypothetical protein F383_37999 [Gossypium arboreum]|uniref:Uncharacterized protein n=1 Tax=Gossypium arboreum TaxID=29729 RepID=A0A0B0M9X0_GOSAR|nr:hypothetical protein F383_37999 [Gossypium arboreum]
MQSKKQGITQGKPIDPSQVPVSSSRLEISLQVPSGVFNFLMFCYLYAFEMFSFISIN